MLGIEIINQFWMIQYCHNSIYCPCLSMFPNMEMRTLSARRCPLVWKAQPCVAMERRKARPTPPSISAFSLEHNFSFKVTSINHVGPNNLMGLID